MLSKILIKNYILIDELELDLAEGLNIITGETGAGKVFLSTPLILHSEQRLEKKLLRAMRKKP